MGLPARDLEAEIAELRAENERLRMRTEKTADANVHAATLMVELEAARDEALAADEAKGRFLAGVTHDLRTPLNGIIGFSEIVLMTRGDKPEARHLKRIVAAAETLLGLIDNILDFSKLDAGRTELEILPFNVKDALDSTIQIGAVLARKKDVEVRLVVDDSVPEYVMGDVIRIQQIFLNLLGNAIKFTQRGHVEVRIRAEPAGNDGQLLVTCDVEDTGAGIPEKALKAIFEPFTQADVSTNRTHGGTGLGLPIVGELAGLMGGAVSVKSKVDEGTTFTVTMMLGQP